MHRVGISIIIHHIVFFIIAASRLAKDADAQRRGSIVACNILFNVAVFNIPRHPVLHLKRHNTTLALEIA